MELTEPEILKLIQEYRKSYKKKKFLNEEEQKVLDFIIDIISKEVNIPKDEILDKNNQNRVFTYARMHIIVLTKEVFRQATCKLLSSIISKHSTLIPKIFDDHEVISFVPIYDYQKEYVKQNKALKEKLGLETSAHI